MDKLARITKAIPREFISQGREEGKALAMFADEIKRKKDQKRKRSM